MKRSKGKEDGPDADTRRSSEMQLGEEAEEKLHNLSDHKAAVPSTDQSNMKKIYYVFFFSSPFEWYAMCPKVSRHPVISKSN